MLTLRLPDGATREVPEGTLPRDIVASIGPRLLRDAVAVQVNGEIQDLITPLRSGGDFRVLTEKDPESLAAVLGEVAGELRGIRQAIEQRNRQRGLQA